MVKLGTRDTVVRIQSRFRNDHAYDMKCLMAHAFRMSLPLDGCPDCKEIQHNDWIETKRGR